MADARSSSSAGVHEHATQAFSEHTGAGMLVDQLERDETLEHPRSVFQILRRHFSRYTPEMVQRICGISRDEFMAVADALIANSGRERTSMFCYANGWTQHSEAVQMIRSAAILQLLLGNVGRPGGGIMAMRGHASIQGSTDVPTLYDLLPGYLHMPRTREGHLTLAEYIGVGKADRGWWSHFDAYIVSLLKAWFGDGGDRRQRLRLRIDTEADRQPFALLDDAPRSGRRRGGAVRDGAEPGGRLSARRPAAPRAGEIQVAGRARLAEIETATFWRDSPEVQSGELRTEEIQTEVFLMPAASHVEKEGTFTNTQRLVQFRDKALDPPGDARSELWFMHHLGKRVKAHYAGSDRAQDWPIVNLMLGLPGARGACASPTSKP